MRTDKIQLENKIFGLTSSGVSLYSDGRSRKSFSILGLRKSPQTIITFSGRRLRAFCLLNFN